MRPFKHAIATATTVLGLSGIASAGTFQYKMRSLPPVSQIACDDFAVTEGQRFSAYAQNRVEGFRLVDSRCFEEEYSQNSNNWNIEITYEASKKLKEVSTYDAGAYEAPGYRKRADCEAALIGEKQLFTQKTGLEIFAAYCRVPAVSDMVWMMNISAFGDAAIIPRNTGAHLVGQILNHTVASFGDLVAARLQKYGAILAQLTLKGNTVDQILAIRYYGSKEFQIEEKVIASYLTPETCSQDIAMTSEALDRIQAIHFGTYCQRHPLGGVIELASVTNQQQNLSFIRSSQPYASFEACQAAKPAVLARYNNDLGRHVELILCSYVGTKKTFDMILIEKKP